MTTWYFNSPRYNEFREVAANANISRQLISNNYDSLMEDAHAIHNNIAEIVANPAIRKLYALDTIYFYLTNFPQNDRLFSLFIDYPHTFAPIKYKNRQLIHGIIILVVMIIVALLLIAYFFDIAPFSENSNWL